MTLAGHLKGSILPGVFITVGLIAAAALSSFVESVSPKLPETYHDTDLTFKASRLKGYCLGFEGLIADWYWMRSLQYIGDKIVNAKAEVVDLDDLRTLDPRLLYPLLENATDLDPHFIAAYVYGAVVLPAIDANKAIAIAQKGIDNNPNAWRLYQHLGYIYWKLKQYDKAAETYEKGSEIGGAAPFMKIMAASMRNEGGSRSTARQIYRAMLDTSDDPMVRLTAERKLKGLDLLDEREEIDRSLLEFRNRTGRCASSLAEIIPALLRVKLPDGRDFRIDSSDRLVDPAGTPYLLDRANCRVVRNVEPPDSSMK